MNTMPWGTASWPLPIIMRLPIHGLLSLPWNLWAFSNDNMHGGNALGRNWNVFPLSELSSSSVKNAMQEGCFYYIHAPMGHEGP